MGSTFKTIIIFFSQAVFLLSAAAAETALERNFKLGGMLTSGNTQTQSFHLAFEANKNRRWLDEITVKGAFYHDSSGGETAVLKSSAMARYAFTFLDKFYSFFRLEGERDQFKELALRLVPAMGVGYWWSDLPDLKIMTEGALGYQHDYLLSGLASGQIILGWRGFYRQSLFNNLMFQEDLYLYPLVENPAKFRLVSEASLALELANSWAVNWGLLIEHNSFPPAGVRQNDLRLTLSLKHSFLVKHP